MRVISRSQGFLSLIAVLAVSASGGVVAQTQEQATAQPAITVTGVRPPALAQLPKGPVIKGIISARTGDKIRVSTPEGMKTIIAVSDETQIRSGGGFLGTSNSKLGRESLLNGLPVTVETAQWEGGLVASRIRLQNKDLKFASMIRNGTDQRFDEQTAATDALRSRVADIDNYNVKATTNVNFDTGKSMLTPQAQADLCAAATQAQQMNNALLLVIGYTDSTGSPDFNQTLSEKRAARVVNYLQQSCGWKPYRMLTPAGMATADPAADNSTPQGKAQNRRVAVNIMVSKAVDGM